MATLTPTAATITDPALLQRRIVTFSLATDMYATGGFVVDHPDIEHIQSLVVINGMGGYGPLCQWDEDDQKLVVYIGDYNNATDGPLIELANASADLQSFTAVRAEIVGV